MFDFYELNLLNKLLHKIKYSEFDQFEVTEFSNSPITNSVLEKIRTEFLSRAQSKSHLPIFELENDIGKAIQKKLEFLDDSSFDAISKFESDQIEKFSKDIIGPIEYKVEEKEKLKNYIINLANYKTGR